MLIPAPLRRACAALFIAFVTAACGAGAPSDAGRTDPDVSPTDAVAPADAPGVSSRCVATTTPRTQSFALASWPAFDATTATDLSSGARVASASVMGAPSSLALSADGAWVFAVVTQADGVGQLGVLRRSGGQATWDHAVAMPAGESPFGVALSSDGARLAVGLGNAVALFDTAGVESGAADALVATVATPAAHRVTIDVAFSRDDRYVFAAMEYDRGVAVIDATTHTLAGTIPIAGSGVTGVMVASDGATLYVTCEASDESIRANPTPETDQIVGSVTVVDVATAATDPAHAVRGRAFVGRAPVRAALSPDGATLWVTVRGSNALLALDTANLLSTTCDPLLSSTPVGPAPVGLALVLDGGVVAVADSNRFDEPTANQTVMFVDVARALAGGSDAVVGQVGVGAFPREMAADGATLFVSDFNSGTVSAIDLATLPPL